ncbi:MAG TPA: hypothetical protein VFZ66_15505 [Herpetosiphonaceae bacterium]
MDKDVEAIANIGNCMSLPSGYRSRQMFKHLNHRLTRIVGQPVLPQCLAPQLQTMRMFGKAQGMVDDIQRLHQLLAEDTFGWLLLKAALDHVDDLRNLLELRSAHG